MKKKVLLTIGILAAVAFICSQVFVYELPEEVDESVGTPATGVIEETKDGEVIDFYSEPDPWLEGRPEGVQND